MGAFHFLYPAESGDDEYRGDHSDTEDEVDSDFDIDEGDEPDSNEEEDAPRRKSRVVTKAYKVCRYVHTEQIPSHQTDLSLVRLSSDSVYTAQSDLQSRNRSRVRSMSDLQSSGYVPTEQIHESDPAQSSTVQGLGTYTQNRSRVLITLQSNLQSLDPESDPAQSNLQSLEQIPSQITAQSDLQSLGLQANQIPSQIPAQSDPAVSGTDPESDPAQSNLQSLGTHTQNRSRVWRRFQSDPAVSGYVHTEQIPSQITAQSDLQSLENYERLEADKKKHVQKKRRFEGPMIRYHSVLMPLTTDALLKEENVDVEGLDQDMPQSTSSSGAVGAGSLCSRTFITFSDDEAYEAAFPPSYRSGPALPVQEVCPVTHKAALYRDPVTDIPYADSRAFRIIREAYRKYIAAHGFPNSDSAEPAGASSAAAKSLRPKGLVKQGLITA
ncbi:hypothetical protein NFI96_031803 [Prochilodus magdalenae]|nr:hypothetical protein NFI96_031803 [Prochilodus magdalenae]